MNSGSHANIRIEVAKRMLMELFVVTALQ